MSALMRFRGLLWSKCRTRKARPIGCILCRGPIYRGDIAWRPITNGYSRMDRICLREHSADEIRL